MAILPKRSSLKLLHCQVQGQRKNEASIHGTAKEFAVNSLACPRVVSISNSTSKGQTRGMLGKRRCLRCGQPLSVHLDHQVLERVARADRQLLLDCNIMLCQHLGVATEEGAYTRDKMSDPAYKPPPRFRLALKLQKGGGVYAGHYGISSGSERTVEVTCIFDKFQ